MALQVEMENDYGLNASNCYIRIEKFIGDRSGIELDIMIYATPTARFESKRALNRTRVMIPYPTGSIRNILEYCYTELKKLPSYTFAKDI